MQTRWLSASVAMADSDYTINHVIRSLSLDVYGFIVAVIILDLQRQRSSQINTPSCFYVCYTREEYRSKYITGAILDSQSYMWSLGGTTICNYAIV